MNLFMCILAWFFEIVGILSCIVTVFLVFLCKAWSKVDEEGKKEGK